MYPYSIKGPYKLIKEEKEIIIKSLRVLKGNLMGKMNSH